MDTDVPKLVRKYSSDEGNYSLFLGETECHITDTSLEDFWIGYCNLIDNKHDRTFFLSEVYRGAVPIIAEGVIRFSSNYDYEELMTQEFILEIVRAYQKVIKENLRVTNSAKELRCVYLQSNSFNNNTACAFRFQFPWCRVKPDYHKKTLRKKVIEELNSRKSMNKLNSHPESGWDEMLDESSISDRVPLYGSSRIKGIPPVLFQACYETRKSNRDRKTRKSPAKLSSGDEDSDNEVFSEEKDSEQDEVDEDEPEMSKGLPFDPTQHSHVRSGFFLNSGFTKDDGKDDKWMPMYLSLYYSPKPTPTLEEKEREDSEPQSEFEGDLGLGDDFDLALQLLSNISKDRKKCPIGMKKIGMCLYNITNGSAHGLQTWLEQCPSLDPEKAAEAYEEFSSQNNRTLKTLAGFAELDSPAEYEAWHKAWAGEALNSAMESLADTDIALAFYRQYWTKFICIGKSDKEWYYFKNNRWNATTNAIEVNNTFSGPFIRIVEGYRHELSSRQLKEKREKERGRLDTSISNIGKLKDKLKRYNYQTTLIKAAACRFNIEGFNDFVNTDIFILPFQNCVLEVDDDSKCIIKRPGEPEDFMTMNTGLKFPDYSLESPDVKKLIVWLKQLFPDDAVRHEVCKWMASVIRGQNMDKKGPMLNGKSNGGKTTLLKTVKRWLGPFYVTWEPSDLLRANQPGAANPAMAAAKFARLVGVEEMGKRNIMSAELFKKVTGNSQMKGRKLFDNGGEFDANFKIIFAFNEPPTIEDADEATKVRLMMIPMKSRWVTKLPGPKEDCAKRRIFEADRFFSKQMNKYARALAWYMYYYYPIYAREGLQDNDTIQGAIDDYWKDMDENTLFLDEVVEYVKDENGEPVLDATISADELYDEFSKWFAKYNKNKKDSVPKPRAFRKTFETDEYLGPLDDDSWHGIQIKVTKKTNKQETGESKKRKTA